MKITEVKIAYFENWQKEHIRSLVAAYRSSPYYDHYADSINALLLQDHLTLFDLFTSVDALINKYLGLSDMNYTETFVKPETYPGVDVRRNFNDANASYAFYNQVFEHKYGFVPNLSILDLLFNKGPESRSILEQTNITFRNNLSLKEGQ